MDDLMLIGISLLFFASCLGLIRFFDSLSRSEQ